MANYTFFSNAKAKAKKDVIVNLNHYAATEAKSEYYTYLDDNGVEQRYSGVVSKSETGYVGKLKVQHTVELTYHPTVDHVEGNEEYYYYTDKSGNKQIYDGPISFDGTTYIGTLTRKKLEDKVIQIYPVKD